MGNPVVHFEISGSDGEPLEAFYSELFGWHMEFMPEMSYRLVDTHAGEGINGGISGSPEFAQYVTFYVAVPDPQATVDKAVSLGGNVVQPVMEIPNVVTLAMLSDPAGNRLGIVKDDGNNEPVSKGSGTPVTWFEAVGPSGAALREFYGALFEWTFSVGDQDYGHVDTGDERGIRGGIGSHPQGGNAATVYAKVADIAATLKRAEELGGKVLMDAMDVGEVTIALLTDPQGNVIGLTNG